MSASEEVMSERLVRIETRLDLLIQRLDPMHTDHETRLRHLEAAVTEIKVRVALVSSLIGTAAGVLSAVVVRLIGG